MNEEKLLTFLNGLTPTAFGQILLNLPETTGYIPEDKAHRERVTALILHMRSSAVKEGMKQLRKAILERYPDADIFDGSVLGGTTRLPERNEAFTGRVEELGKLHAALTRNGTAAVTQAITGLGGMGKTALAVEYAHTHSEDFSFIFLANASSVSALEASYREIATRLNLQQAKSTDTGLVVEAVKAWLSGGNGYPQETKGYLLIYDNADFSQEYNAEDFRRFLPSGAKGKILITTRSQTLAGVPNITRANLIPINELLPPDAVQFLWERVNGKDIPIPDAEQATISELASRLHYFPLALEQAAAYIQQNQMPYAEYLSDYRAAPMDMLAEAVAVNGHFSREDEYRQAIHTTWHFNLQALQQAGNMAAVDLFTLCAFLTPDNIPDTIIYAAAAGIVESLTALFAGVENEVQRKNRYRSVVRSLSDYSLVTPGADGHNFNVHRLTQDVVKHRLQDEETIAWQSRVIETLNGAFPKVDFLNWPLCQWLIPNVMTLLEPLQSPQTRPETASRLLNQVPTSSMNRGVT